MTTLTIKEKNVTVIPDSRQTVAVLLGIWGVAVAIGSPDGQRAISFPAVHLPLGHRIPAKVQLPVEASVRHVGTGHVLEGVVADHVDDGAHHRSPARTNTHTLIMRCKGPFRGVSLAISWMRGSS